MSFSTDSWLLTHILLFLPLFHPLFAATHTTPKNATCHSTCGTLPVKFPFGTGFGCGHADFSRYIRCSSGTLQFSTGTGVYTISSIDYPSNTLILTDPLMSNCSSMQNSGSFSLDSSSPFSLVAEDTFVLLGCSTTSPVFDQNEELCNTGSGLHICRGMYSCTGVTGIGLTPNAPISTCCVYDPQIVLGSGFMLDLPKLQCSSYTAIYGYGGDEGDPMKWQFGISLRYNDSYSTEACRNCEDSGGLCGFAGLNESFACICRNGVNTSNNCFGRGYAWSGTWRPKIQIKMGVGGDIEPPFARSNVAWGFTRVYVVKRDFQNTTLDEFRRVLPYPYESIECPSWRHEYLKHLGCSLRYALLFQDNIIKKDSNLHAMKTTVIVFFYGFFIGFLVSLITLFI